MAAPFDAFLVGNIHAMESAFLLIASSKADIEYYEWCSEEEKDHFSIINIYCILEFMCLQRMIQKNRTTTHCIGNRNKAQTY